MRVEYINPFVESAMQILKSTVSEDIKRGDLALETTSRAKMQGVAIIIGLAGQVSGRVVIDMNESTALQVASAMNGETLSELDELVSATLTELGNMITGSAVTKLHQKGFEFDITPPALFTGVNLVMKDEIEALIVPIDMNEGRININVAIKEH